MGLEMIKTFFRWFYRAIGVLINNVYCIPTYVIWCAVLTPLYYVDAELYWRIEGQFFQWLLTMVAYWSYSAGYRIVETGDTIDDIINEETLVLVNHQSTSDVPLLMHAFSCRDGLLQRLNWIMDAVFQFTNFGVVSSLHGDFFINAGRNRRDASLRDLEKFLRKKFAPRRRKWLVLFPEGGFLRKRKEASKRYAAKIGLPNLDYVTLPRMGALQTIINTLCPPKGMSKVYIVSAGKTRGLVPNPARLKYIVDMTIAYPNGNPLDLGAVITGYTPPCEIRMHYQIYPINEVPIEQPDLLQHWLYNLYIEKNNMLGHYYKTGRWIPNSRFIDINKYMKRRRSIESSSEDNADVVDRAATERSEEIGNSDLHGESSKRKDRSGKGNESRRRRKSIEEEECIYEPMTDEEMEKAEGRVLHLDLLRVFVLHIMFICSTLFHLALFRLFLELIKQREELF